MNPHPNTRHGHGRSGKNHNATPTYTTWALMKNRCLNPRAPNFGRYGGRGITICNRWHSFDNFLFDMGTRPIGKTLDRINNSQGYFKGNCRWVTPSEQQRNRRTNVHITYQDRTQCLSAWAQQIGITPSTLSYRLKHWSLEKIFSVGAKNGSAFRLLQKERLQQRDA